MVWRITPILVPTLTLLAETAMRSSGPLQRARWGDVDWDNKLLKLRDAKTSQRDVRGSNLLSSE